MGEARKIWRGESGPGEPRRPPSAVRDGLRIRSPPAAPTRNLAVELVFSPRVGFRASAGVNAKRQRRSTGLQARAGGGLSPGLQRYPPPHSWSSKIEPALNRRSSLSSLDDKVKPLTPICLAFALTATLLYLRLVYHPCAAVWG